MIRKRRKGKREGRKEWMEGEIKIYSFDRMLGNKSAFPIFYLLIDIFLISFISISLLYNECQTHINVVGSMTRGTVLPSKEQATLSLCTHIISVACYLELHIGIPEGKSQKNARKHDYSTHYCHVLS